jgi:uncharacterized protein (TIGR02118 family)
MVKVIFFAYAKEGMTPAQAMAEAGGDLHSSFMQKLPGLRRWVVNHPIYDVPEQGPDWVSELCFDDRDALDACMNSPEMAADMEDGKRFADLNKTYSVIVEEKVHIG